MKKIILLSLILLSKTAFSQKMELQDLLPMKDSLVNYTGVIQVDSTSKEILYQKSKNWSSSAQQSLNLKFTFENNKDEMTTKGTFIEDWNVVFSQIIKVNIAVNIKIDVKDNKIRYEISEFNISYLAPLPPNPSMNDLRRSTVNQPLEVWYSEREKNKKAQGLIKQIDDQIKKAIVSLQKELKTSNDNW